MRLIALLAVYNGARFIGGCIEHLHRQGVCTYLIDNESTDATAKIAARHLGRGLVGMESLPRNGHFELLAILTRKQELAASLDADWFLHVDVDEIRLPPPGQATLVEALAWADTHGWNAVNFQEFTFLPTEEDPDHDHLRFVDTMRWYYAFLPQFPHRLTAWKRQSGPVDLVSAAGHRVNFERLRACPVSFPMRHYLFLSRRHAVEKYVSRGRKSDEVSRGWGGWRNEVATGHAALDASCMPLPHEAELSRFEGDHALDASHPLTRHVWCEMWAAEVRR